ncbi:MAG: hypothetical protein U0R72_12900 [Nakamurella multipartita]
MFIVSSKTFTTLETMTNAHTARTGHWPRWVTRPRWPSTSSRCPQRRGGQRVRHRHRQHVRLLELGRRPLLHGIGHRPVHDDRHRTGELRPAAGRLHAVDEHFRSTLLRENLPVLMGLLTFWYSSSSARRPRRSCPTTSTCCASRPTCSS